MGVFLFHRLEEWPLYRSKTLWGLESLIFVVMIAGFATRRAPVAGPRGFMEAVFPFGAAAFPFAMFLLPVRHDVIAWRPAYDAAEGLLIAGSLLTVTGMAFLRRSFGISVAAREPVLRGPYRFVRHPVYLGEIISLAGVVVIRWSATAVAVVVLFAVLQGVRACLEERKLAEAFPEYEEYRRRTGMLLPRLFGPARSREGRIVTQDCEPP